jgi:hypothetical protein
MSTQPNSGYWVARNNVSVNGLKKKMTIGDIFFALPITKGVAIVPGSWCGVLFNGTIPMKFLMPTNTENMDIVCSPEMTNSP